MNLSRYTAEESRNTL